eukprot:6178470-Pleurochrysis_carterae.AAC.1
MTRNNPLTGILEEINVLRSDPAGVQLMARYPDVKDNPGVEDWLPPDKWSSRRVFSDIHNWKYDKAENTQ